MGQSYKMAKLKFVCLFVFLKGGWVGIMESIQFKKYASSVCKIYNFPYNFHVVVVFLLQKGLAATEEVPRNHRKPCLNLYLPFSLFEHVV